jgi:hypothetical protein
MTMAICSDDSGDSGDVVVIVVTVNSGGDFEVEAFEMINSQQSRKDFGGFVFHFCS